MAGVPIRKFGDRHTERDDGAKRHRETAIYEPRRDTWNKSFPRGLRKSQSCQYLDFSSNFKNCHTIHLYHLSHLFEYSVMAVLADSHAWQTAWAILFKKASG